MALAETVSTRPAGNILVESGGDVGREPFRTRARGSRRLCNWVPSMQKLDSAAGELLDDV